MYLQVCVCEIDFTLGFLPRSLKKKKPQNKIALEERLLKTLCPAGVGPNLLGAGL